MKMVLRRIAIVAVVMTAMGMGIGGGVGWAQSLDLPPAAPRPAWDADQSAFTRLRGRLRMEIRQLGDEVAASKQAAASEEADARARALASAAWRRIAAAVLERGALEGAAGDQLMLMGLQMALVRSTVDAVLAEMSEDEEAAALTEFAQRAEQEAGVIASRSPAEARRAAYRMAAPLRELLETQRAARVEFWPRERRGDPSAAAPPRGTALVAQRLSALEEAIAASGLPERSKLRTLYAERMGTLRASPAVRTSSDGADGGSEGGSAQGGRGLADQLAEDLARSIDAVSALPAVREPAAQRTLREVLEALESAAPELRTAEVSDERHAWRRRMDWFIGAASALPDRQELTRPPRLFAAVVNQLQRAGRLAERSTVEALERLAKEPQGWTDPGVITGLTAMHAYRQDLQRLPAMAEWPDRIGAMDADAGRRMANWLRQWAEHLSDPMRRDAARGHLLRLERELAMHDELVIFLEPSDAWEFQNLAGGRAAELQSAVADLQRSWAQAWGTGTPDDVLTRRLEDLALLAETFEDGVSMAARGGGRSPLLYWPGWEMLRTVLSRLSSELPIRIRLASTAASQRDWAALRHECAVIDRELPVVRLIVALVEDLEDDLHTDAEDHTALVLRAISPPPSDARWARHLAALATVCRFVFEAEAARALREEDAASAAWKYASRVAGDVLEAR